MPEKESHMHDDTIITLPLSDIHLDENNPRLPTAASRGQNEMALYIARNTSITELMTAIAENGYFPGEPIVVVPRDTGGYTVVEGNRRVTALRLLRDPSLLSRNPTVRDISESASNRPDSVPCVVFPRRDDVVNYLGYRHISGVKQWEPLSKARYITQYFVTHTNNDSAPLLRYREVARGIGSRSHYIKRQLDGYSVYLHIENARFYDIKGLNEETISFSLLSTALGYDTILRFVSSSKHPCINPESLKSNEIRDLTKWMYEKNLNGETVLGESRNIRRLATIVAEEHSLSLLREYQNLRRAYSATTGVAKDFNKLLSDIEWRIREAVATVALVMLDDIHRSKMSDIFKQARYLRRAAEDD